MDRTVSDAFLAAGPDGWMEFGDFGDEGDGVWRMHYADGTIWFPPEEKE